MVNLTSVFNSTLSYLMNMSKLYTHNARKTNDTRFKLKKSLESLHGKNIKHFQEVPIKVINDFKMTCLIYAITKMLKSLPND